MKNKPLKKQSTTPPDTKTQNYFLEIRERIRERMPPTETGCGVVHSEAEVHGN